jgi:hypothetical protein
MLSRLSIAMFIAVALAAATPSDAQKPEYGSAAEARPCSKRLSPR